MKSIPSMLGAYLCLSIPMLIPAAAHAAGVESDLRCFVGTSPQKTKLEMMRYSDDAHGGWTGGYVKYGKNKPPITIVYVSSKTLDQPEGRPAYFESTWVEVATAEVTGKYIVGSQGANVYSFEYVNRKTDKKYSFDETVERNSTDDGCKW
ncbi:hypothetical protein [Collimonas fungivorans]|uniref:hypothetical protein n=1 Tax=Collimonas fungivorans TaxID=158899 RepID=UPI003FA3D3FC